MGRSFVQIDTAQVVYDDDGYSPLIGNDAVDSPYTFAPWKWDERIWMHRSNENLSSAIPTPWDPPWVRLPREYILSGVASEKIDLEVLKIIKKRKESLDIWVPEIRHGNYFKFTRGRYFFANRSVTQFIHTDDNEGSGPGDGDYPNPDNPARNVLQLTHTPRHGSPIFAAIWGRNTNDEPQIIKFIRKRGNFTGNFDTSGQMETRHGILNEIKWPAVDRSKKEFVMDWTASPPKLIFNQDFTYLIGREDLTSDDELEYCELLGRGTGEVAQLYLTRRFPIVDNAEIMLMADHYYNEWARFRDIGRHDVRITQVRNSGEADEETDCNHQIGHKFFVQRTSSTRPEDRGVYSVDTDRGEITFPEFLVTNPSDTQEGRVVTRAPASGSLMYLRYRPTVEVEYEPENCDRVSHPTEVNLNPITTALNAGFIYISEQDMRVASIILTVEKPLIYGKTDTYGPVLIGADYAFLVATAYSRFGIPVPGATIEFYFPDRGSTGDFGRLGGREDSTTAITDGDVQARVAYAPPRSAEEIGTYIDHPSGDPDDKLVVPDGVEIDPSVSIYTYRVYSGDPWSPWVPGTAIDSGRGGRKVILYQWDEDAVHPRTGMQGAYTPVTPSLTRDRSKLSYPTGVIEDTPKVEGDLTLQAYWVSAGKDIHVRTKAYSTLYNRDIKSNSVYLRIDLPEYLKGTYVAENIGASPPSNIPYGFRFFDEYFSKASGLDGLTYLSINPASGYWNIIWPDDDSGQMRPTHRVEDTDPFTDTGRHLWLDDNGVVASTGHKLSVAVKTSCITGHKFYVKYVPPSP
jgi:hypothetical protein